MDGLHSPAGGAFPPPPLMASPISEQRANHVVAYPRPLPPPPLGPPSLSICVPPLPGRFASPANSSRRGSTALPLRPSIALLLPGPSSCAAKYRLGPPPIHLIFSRIHPSDTGPLSISSFPPLPLLLCSSPLISTGHPVIRTHLHPISYEYHAAASCFLPPRVSETSRRQQGSPL